MSASDCNVKPEWTVIAPYIAQLIESAVTLGANREELLQSIGITESQLADPELRFPMTLLMQLFDEAASLTQCEDFGIESGSTMQPQAMGLLGYLSCCCNNMLEALETFVPLRRIMMHSGTTECVKSPSCVSFIWTPLSAAFVEKRYFVDTIFSGWLAIHELTGNERVKPLKVEFVHDEPFDLQRIHDVFGENVLFNCQQNKITFSREDVERSFVSHDQELHQALVSEAEVALKKVPESLLTTAMVEKQMMRLLPAGDCSLVKVAEALHMTERTLQRRLKVDQTRFNELLKGLRRRWARNYLAETSMPVTDIALLLGYQETSAFTHAFRSWLDVSPAEYRRKMREEEKSLQ
jgi:AraC-like DNA-binding protein